MSSHTLAPLLGTGPVASSGTTAVELAGGNQTLVVVVAVIAVVALVMAVVFRSQVLAYGEGTAKMQEIALAVQEGASAYLNRQFRTLALFVVLVFALLFLLPGDCDIRARAQHLLRPRRRLLGRHRLPGHVARRAGQRPRGRRGPRGRRQGGRHPDRVPHRRRGRHGHRRASACSARPPSS